MSVRRLTGEVSRMRVPHVEDLASHGVPESCVVVGNHECEALTGGDVGQVLSRENVSRIWSADALDIGGRPCRVSRHRETHSNSARSETLCMHPSTSCGNREIPRLTRGDGPLARIGNSKEATR